MMKSKIENVVTEYIQHEQSEKLVQKILESKSLFFGEHDFHRFLEHFLDVRIR